MPIYSCAVVGTGTDADPIRPPFSGDRRIGWICLAPPGSASGRGLLYTPEPVSGTRVRLIADDPSERPSLATRGVLENELGITLQRPSTTALSELVSEILREHGRTDGTRWGVLRPSRARRRLEIWLGALGVIWHAPAAIGPSTQTFTESWPTDSTTISSGQDQSWTEVLSDLEVSGGVLRAVATSGGNQARCESALDTSDQYHQAEFVMADGVTALNNAFLCVRYADNNNHYRVRWIRRSTTGHLRIGEKRVSSVTTTIVTGDTSDPGASGVAQITIDGSTMTIQIGAFSANATDGAPQLLTTFTGGLSVSAPSAVGDATLDNHTIADVVAGGGLHAPLAGDRPGLAGGGRGLAA